MSSFEERFITAKRKLFDRVYSSLNDKQREAVYTVNGPLLILAGAGSGKTTVLVNRIAHIIRYGDSYNSTVVPRFATEENIAELESALKLDRAGAMAVLDKYAVAKCPAWETLCITFTNKAAGEIKERLQKAIGDEAKDVWAGTFHSICVRILRRYPTEAGLAPGFTIYDTDDAKKIIGDCIKELLLDEKIYTPKICLELISRAKDKLQTPEDMAREATRDMRIASVSKIYSAYQKKLNDANAVDFDDIIVRTVTLLLNCDEARDYYQGRFKYVSVDEYQDTNCAQFKLTELLSGRYRNLMAVGDDDQSIYRFRGATIENILNFEKVIPDAKTIKLEQNYRSTGLILDAANAVIANNSSRHDKKLWTSREGGEKITLTKLTNQIEESKNIVDTIISLVGSGKYHFSDMAVLYRVNAQSNNIEQALAKSAVAYRLIGGLRFYERKEIKDIIAYLCVLQNHADNVRLKRIINEPKRKIGSTAIDEAEQIATENGKSLYYMLENCMDYPTTARFTDKFYTFTSLIEKLDKVKQTAPLSELVESVYIMTGYRDMLLEQGFEGKERADNIKELISNAVAYENAHENATLEGFLEDVALVADVDNYDKEADAVTLMTIHSAKGLEFPVVFLPGMEEGLFPMSQATQEPEELEEERRMAYVAYTRAKDKLYCSCVKERLIYGRTQYNRISRFIEEVPKEYFEEKCTYKTLNRISDSSDGKTAIQGRMTMGFSKKKQELSSGFTHTVDIPTTVKPKIQAQVKAFAVGDEVIHPTFGKGSVLSAKPMGADILYEVAFERVGTKKLMAAYSKLQPANT